MLPQGYVLNTDKGAQRSDDEEEELTLEEKIEEERAALPSEGLTPVTLDSFMAWKKAKEERKKAELEAKIAAEEAKGRKDKGQMAFMSGRALFTYNPDLFEDAEGAIDEQQYDEDFDENGEEESKEERKEA